MTNKFLRNNALIGLTIGGLSVLYLTAGVVWEGVLPSMSVPLIVISSVLILMMGIQLLFLRPKKPVSIIMLLSLMLLIGAFVMAFLTADYDPYKDETIDQGQKQSSSEEGFDSEFDDDEEPIVE